MSCAQTLVRCTGTVISPRSYYVLQSTFENMPCWLLRVSLSFVRSRAFSKLSLFAHTCFYKCLNIDLCVPTCLRLRPFSLARTSFVLLLPLALFDFARTHTRSLPVRAAHTRTSICNCNVMATLAKCSRVMTTDMPYTEYCRTRSFSH